MEKYYIEVLDNNSELDDYFRINAYEKSTNKYVGFIDIEILYDGYSYLSDELTEEEYDEIFDSEIELLHIQHVEVCKEYRNKGIGNFLMKKLINEVIPKYLSNYKYLTLYRSAYNIPDELKQQYNTNILIKFYETFGFKEIEYAPNYMVRKINE